MTEPDDHRSEVERWRAGRYDALRRDLGWLTLAGLDWLRPGANRVGSGDDNDVVLGDGPAHVGSVTVGEDGTVTATGSWRHAGRPVDGLPLVPDEAGAPTVLELGDLRQCLIIRGGRPALRTWNLASPARARFRGLPHWPVDPSWRLRARFEATSGRSISVPDVLGIDEERASPGVLAFEVAGVTHRLEALEGGPDGDLWLVFADWTNGRETYGGGRFLYTSPPEADGSFVVDFNRAYNPPCVFSPYATCPLPWPANRLPVRVEAGEQLPPDLG